ncbi:hypothetical protein BZA77DRAFT_34087 [Pyronema omphalodes]|nr:hypothetical protein BZA77DRAFT_34087 [Pyronema omphalodes]
MIFHFPCIDSHPTQLPWAPVPFAGSFLVHLWFPFGSLWLPLVRITANSLYLARLVMYAALFSFGIVNRFGCFSAPLAHVSPTDRFWSLASAYIPEEQYLMCLEYLALVALLLLRSGVSPGQEAAQSGDLWEYISDHHRPWAAAPC